MELHTDVKAFKVLLQMLHEQSGICTVVLEKERPITMHVILFANYYTKLYNTKQYYTFMF